MLLNIASDKKRTYTENVLETLRKKSLTFIFASYTAKRN